MWATMRGTGMEAIPIQSGGPWFGHAELYYWLLRNKWQKSNARIALQVA